MTWRSTSTVALQSLERSGKKVPINGDEVVHGLSSIGRRNLGNFLSRFL